MVEVETALVIATGVGLVGGVGGFTLCYAKGRSYFYDDPEICADCPMPYQRVGARKVTNHHVRSPLLGMAGACMTCHGG